MSAGIPGRCTPGYCAFLSSKPAAIRIGSVAMIDDAYRRIAAIP
jgi:hypothetical protein